MGLEPQFHCVLGMIRVARFLPYLRGGGVLPQTATSLHNVINRMTSHGSNIMLVTLGMMLWFLGKIVW